MRSQDKYTWGALKMNLQVKKFDALKKKRALTERNKQVERV